MRDSFYLFINVNIRSLKIFLLNMCVLQQALCVDELKITIIISLIWWLTFILFTLKHQDIFKRKLNVS